MNTIVYKLHNAKKYPLISAAIQKLKKNGKGKIAVPSNNKLNGIDSYREAILKP